MNRFLQKGWLTNGLMLCLALAYLVYLTGDAFLPNQKIIIVAGLIGLALMLGLWHIYLTYPLKFTKAAVSAWLAVYGWTLFGLGLALSVGAFLRWQAIDDITETTSRQQLVNSAFGVLRKSNWQPDSLATPPLYLYLTVVLTAVTYVQQAGAGRAQALDDIDLNSALNALPWLNLGLGLLAIVLTLIIANQMLGARGGAVAALLTATAWTHYATAAQPAPQNLAIVLVLLAFYQLINLRQAANGRWFIAGLLIGLASGAAYGAVLLLGIGIWQVFQSRETGVGSWESGVSKQEEVQNQQKLSAISYQPLANPTPNSQPLASLLAGFILAFTLAVAGWLLNLPRFLNGLAEIGRAGGNNLEFFWQQFFKYDAGLLLACLLLLIASLLPLLNRILKIGSQNLKLSTPEIMQRQNLKLALAFVLLYFFVLIFIGAPIVTRLALVSPFIAIDVARLIESVANKIRQILNDGQHNWAGNTLAISLAFLIILISIAVRRAL